MSASRLFAVSAFIVVSACAGPEETGAVSPNANEDQTGVIDSALMAKAGYQITPFGYVHQSCIFELAETEVATATGSVIGADNTERATAPCTHSIIKPHASTTATTSTINGWVESEVWITSTTPTSLSTSWVVPPVPTVSNGQTIFFFPGFEPTSGDRIVQPVLQFGSSSAGGGAYWTIGSWFVSSGKTFHSKLSTVAAGDTIFGSMTSSKCTRNGGCTFTIVTTDTTSKASQTLVFTDTITYGQIESGVLEVYGVTACNQLPAAKSTTFTNLQIVSARKPTWNKWVFSVPLQCGFSVSNDATSATMSYSGL